MLLNIFLFINLLVQDVTLATLVRLRVIIIARTKRAQFTDKKNHV